MSWECIIHTSPLSETTAHTWIDITCTWCFNTVRQTRHVCRLVTRGTGNQLETSHRHQWMIFIIKMRYEGQCMCCRKGQALVTCRACFTYISIPFFSWQFTWIISIRIGIPHVHYNTTVISQTVLCVINTQQIILQFQFWVNGISLISVNCIFCTGQRIDKTSLVIQYVFIIRLKHLIITTCWITISIFLINS